MAAGSGRMSAEDAGSPMIGSGGAPERWTSRRRLFPCAQHLTNVLGHLHCSFLDAFFINLLRSMSSHQVE